MAERERRFSEAEVEAILRRAVARQDHRGALSRDELADVLRQMNLDDSAVDEAIAENDAEREVGDEVAAWKFRRRRSVRGHAITYASVMTLLVAVNLVLTPHALWFVWPLIGWGFALLSDFRHYQRGPGERELASRRRQQCAAPAPANQQPRRPARPESVARQIARRLPR